MQHRSSAAALLFLGYTPASAQYYMNVFKKNGETVQFEVAELDNVSFTSTEVPAYEYADTWSFSPVRLSSLSTETIVSMLRAYKS